MDASPPSSITPADAKQRPYSSDFSGHAIVVVNFHSLVIRWWIGEGHLPETPCFGHYNHCSKLSNELVERSGPGRGDLRSDPPHLGAIISASYARISAARQACSSIPSEDSGFRRPPGPLPS